ncbi:MAG: alpha/beta fold hydrolase [Actinomycetota bacterium]
MRAIYPESEGYIERDGVKIFYERYGDGDPTVLFLPTFAIVHSRMWKAQIPYLARHFRVVCFDPRGNGRSDRPISNEAYSDDEYVQDALDVMASTGTERAVLVGLCTGVRWAVQLAVARPDKSLGVIAFAPGIAQLSPPHSHRLQHDFDARLDTEEGWAKENRHYWLRDFKSYAGFFLDQLLPEPHSTKQWEDAVGWACETTAETLLAVLDSPGHGRTTLGVSSPGSSAEAEKLCRSLKCPTLVVAGDQDMCQPLARAERLAELAGGSLVVLEGAGHQPQARHPVKVNGLIRSFIESLAPTKPATARWTQPMRRPKRALFVSSPIGLGHARRDVAIAQELRKLHPDLEIEWLAQHPVTRVLETEGESVHPASEHLANESQHIESECAEHDLHALQAIRNMDEILVANFMVFDDLVRDKHFDLWIADEGWELDYFLHENPELKKSNFAWLTDFVGWLPMPGADDRERFVAADLNAEMIEHIERFPRLRDRSVFVGNPDDIVPRAFGESLPGIRSWTEQHFSFSGYVTGFNPTDLSDREALRAELGYSAEEKVCIVTVGGSGVGSHLLRRIIAAYPEAKRAVPELRMIVVAGPRIDPKSLPAHEGLGVRGYVHGLYRHLAACDLALVHGGLTTTMELTANQRPFLYFPLRNHFEQNLHVRHRLERYGGGRCMDFDAASPEAIDIAIADAIAREVGRDVNYRAVETDGAARAANLLAELL